MTIYVSPFTGDVIQPTDVSYASVSFSANVQLYWPQYVATAGQQVAARIMEFTATTAGLNIYLPNAQQTSVGQDILIRNMGVNSFVVNRFGGGGSFTVAAGQSFYTYLVDNTTTAGVWAVLQFGTGTSSADANSLAGVSTAAIMGKLEAAFVTAEYNLSNPTIDDSSRGSCLVWTGGSTTWTLPPVSQLSTGWFILVRNNGSGALTITSSSITSTIDAQTNIVLPLGDSCFICVNRDPVKQDFFTVGRARPNSLTFTSATYDVDTIVGSTYSIVTNTPIIQRYTALSGSRTTSLLVQLPAVTQVYYIVNDTGQSGYNINLQVQGSSQAPIALTNASQIILLSDGNFLYVLNQSIAGQQTVLAGSAGAPGYAFLTDTATGMYLANPSQLAFSAGGVNILTLDTTGGVGNFVSKFIGRLQADLISGGSF
jgi:hypothetical protein